jgi:hypothetical protein
MVFGEMPSGSADPMLTHGAGRFMSHFSGELPEWEVSGGAAFGEGPINKCKVDDFLVGSCNTNIPLWSAMVAGGRRRLKWWPM